MIKTILITLISMVLLTNVAYCKTPQPVELNLNDYALDDSTKIFFNDPYFDLQDYLIMVNFPKAFANYQNDESLYVLKNLDTKKPVVAILSYGFIPNYDDTLNHIWVNPNEIPNNLKDDDNNGYTDDYNIINFKTKNYNDTYNISYYVDRDYLIENYPGYLTQIYMGSATGNQKDYAGLLFDDNIKLMLIDISGDIPSGNTGITFFEAGLKYILNMKDRGVNIVSVVLALPETIRYENIKYSLIKELSDRRIFFVMPSGAYENERGGFIGKNIDLETAHPCHMKMKYEYDMRIKLDNFICVGLMDRTNKLIPDSMSNFGENTVDFITPGKFTLEEPGNTLHSSMFSAAIIAAAVANAKIMYPEFSNAKLKELLYSSGDKNIPNSRSKILFDFNKLFLPNGIGGSNNNI